MKAHAIRPQFVEFMPKDLQDGVLYISHKYRTASHRCCCGCGTKIVTPLRETEYRLIERDGAISLYPSIGNWNHPCQSHYWIKESRVEWAPSMTKSEIQRGRAQDDAARAAYFSSVTWPWWRRVWSRVKRWRR